MVAIRKRRQPYMEAMSLIDGQLRNRKYANVTIARKQWHCDRCGHLIQPGDTYEHSRSYDNKRDVRLCLHCSAIVEVSNVSST